MIVLLDGDRTTMISTYATLVVAVIAGAFSLIGLVISKEQKVSEFRQSWIDALREDISNLIAHANLIHAELLKLAQENPPDKRKFLDRTARNHIATNRSTTRIKLRLNLTEADSQALHNSIQKLDALLTTDPSVLVQSQDEITSINLKIEEDAAKVLKAEWERVKDGELNYRVAKLSALILFAGAIIVAIVAILSARRLGMFG
jgi:hypothetical protein